MAKIMDAIVIGCGASGVAALSKLQEAGLKVLGLEGADRIGGRINTVPFGANVVDVGAAWCHGEESNVVFELANPLDLLARPHPDPQDWYFLSSGRLLPNGQFQTLQSAVNNAVQNADKSGTSSISECVRHAAETDETLKASELTKYVVSHYEHNNNLGGEDDPQRGKSLKGLDECWLPSGEPMLNWKDKGYRILLDVLLKKHPDPSQALPVEILLNKEVESIRWSSNQFGQDSDHPLVQVKCKDDSLYTAKSVIITVSIGVLKERHATLFNPPLPAAKVNAINNLELCVLSKIYVQFKKPWWQQSPTQFTILWTEQDRETIEPKWVPEIYGANTVEHQPNVLLFWLYGNGARMMEHDTEDNVAVGVAKLLDKLRQVFDVSEVNAIKRSQWSANPLIRGAYSYRCVATEVHGGGAVELSEPLCNDDTFPVVCFAGEATSHHRHNSVHGAVEAGFREAERLINAIKLKEGNFIQCRRA